MRGLARTGIMVRMARAAPGSAGRLRRWWPPVVAVLVTVGLGLSDWPLNWTFWVAHPLLAALVPGLVLLLVAAAVVDAYLRRKEAARWQNVGGAAAGQWFSHFSYMQMTMHHLLGFDLGGRLTSEIEYHLSPARQRAAHLVPTSGDGKDPWDVTLGQVQRAASIRMPILLRDEEWRDHAFVCLSTLTARQAELLAQWASIYAAMGDDTNFRRLGETVGIIELTQAFQDEMTHVQDVESPDSPVDDSMGQQAVESAIELWTALQDRVVTECIYWAAQQRDRSTIEDRWRWRRDEFNRRVTDTESSAPKTGLAPEASVADPEPS